MSEASRVLFRTDKRTKRHVRDMARVLAENGVLERGEMSSYIKRALRNQLRADARDYLPEQ